MDNQTILVEAFKNPQVSAKKYESFLYQTKTWIALRILELQILEFQGNPKKPWPDYCETVQIREFATAIGNSEYIGLRESTMEFNVV